MSLSDDILREMADTAGRARSGPLPTVAWARTRELGGRFLGELCAEIIELRKQALLDRQSREASQAEFARLNRELNEAKERIKSMGEQLEMWKMAAR